MIQKNNYKQVEDGKMFFDAQESRDSILLKSFNDDVKWFDGLTANTRMSEIDYQATDRKGRLVHIELKEREGDIAKYLQWGDVLVEPSKIQATTRIMESGHTNDEQRLLINFVDDGVIVFNLNNLSRMNFYPNHKHWNRGKKCYENEDRFGLPMKDAIIYKMRYEDGRLERLKQWELDEI